MKLTAMAPSPTAEAQRFTDPLRTSPAANTPCRRPPQIDVVSQSLVARRSL